MQEFSEIPYSVTARDLFWLVFWHVYIHDVVLQRHIYMCVGKKTLGRWREEDGVRKRVWGRGCGGQGLTCVRQGTLSVQAPQP